MNYERQSATIYTAGPWHQRIWVIYADALCSCGLAVCKGIRRFRIRRRAFYSLRKKCIQGVKRRQQGQQHLHWTLEKELKADPDLYHEPNRPAGFTFLMAFVLAGDTLVFSFQKKTVLSCSSPARDCIYRPANSTNRLCAGAGCLRGRST